MCKEVQSSDSVSSVSHLATGTVSQWTADHELKGCPKPEQLSGPNRALCNINGCPTVYPAAQSSHHFFSEVIQECVR